MWKTEVVAEAPSSLNSAGAFPTIGGQASGDWGSVAIPVAAPATAAAAATAASPVAAITVAAATAATAVAASAALALQILNLALLLLAAAAQTLVIMIGGGDGESCGMSGGPIQAGRARAKRRLSSMY